MFLPNKEPKTYELAFTMFMATTKKQFQNGATFITDFVKALSNSVKKALMIYKCLVSTFENPKAQFQTAFIRLREIGGAFGEGIKSDPLLTRIYNPLSPAP